MLPRPNSRARTDGRPSTSSGRAGRLRRGIRGSRRRPTTGICSVSSDIDRLATVFGEGRLLERGLAALEVEELVAAGGGDDLADRTRHPHLEHVIVALDVRHARDSGERVERDGPGEDERDVVVREVAKRLDAVDTDEAALADDRDAVGRPFDLADDVTREEHRPAGAARLADEVEERLLDERVEARGGLVEDEEVGLVLERNDEADLLLVALRVLAIAP